MVLVWVWHIYYGNAVKPVSMPEKHMQEGISPLLEVVSLAERERESYAEISA